MSRKKLDFAMLVFYSETVWGAQCHDYERSFFLRHTFSEEQLRAVKVDLQPSRNLKYKNSQSSKKLFVIDCNRHIILKMISIIGKII